MLGRSIGGRMGVPPRDELWMLEHSCWRLRSRHKIVVRPSDAMLELAASAALRYRSDSVLDETSRSMTGPREAILEG